MLHRANICNSCLITHRFPSAAVALPTHLQWLLHTLHTCVHSVHQITHIYTGCCTAYKRASAAAQSIHLRSMVHSAHICIGCSTACVHICVPPLLSPKSLHRAYLGYIWDIIGMCDYVSHIPHPTSQMLHRALFPVIAPRISSQWAMLIPLPSLFTHLLG